MGMYDKKRGMELQNVKKDKLASIFLVFLLSFSLVAAPLQSVAYAEAEFVEPTSTAEEDSMMKTLQIMMELIQRTRLEKQILSREQLMNQLNNLNLQ